jgi:Tol biopolymer transport system component
MTILDKDLLRRDTSKAMLPAYWPARRNTMTKVLTVFVLAAIAFGADTTREQKLQQAINLMESKGDAAKAMPMLEDVARSSDRALAARALLYLGQAQERQGTDKARATYERIVKEFGNQTEMVAAAQQRLVALGGARSSGTLAKRLLCADCGDSEADFSADGRWMAFTHWDSGDLAIRDMFTGQVKRLLAKTGTWNDSDAFVETPILSPDLRQIAYLWYVDDKQDQDHVQLRIVSNELGGAGRVLVDNKENIWYTPTNWSPDGKSVLVIISKKDKTDQLARVAISDGSVRVLRSVDWRFKGGAWSHPIYSPDGQYIVYSARAVNPSKDPPAPTDPKDEHIYLMAADGSSETEIVKTAGINRNPVWTPDGKHILFTSDRSGRMDLWSVAVQNGKAIGSASQVSSEIGNANAMGVHGGSYYYTHPSPSAEYVNIVDWTPGAGSGRLVRPTESFVGIRPTWSPDGKSIAFKRHHPGSTNEYDLVVHSLETGDERTYLTSLGTTGNGAARWFHDGKSIMTGIRRGDGSAAFYRIDLKTGDFKELGDFPTYALSLDDKTAYIIRRDPKDPNNVPDRISAVDLSTRQEKQVLAMPTPGAAALALTPDGRTLVIKWPDQKTVRFARVNVDGTGYREIFNMTRQDDGGPMALTKDGRWIIFEESRDDKWRLMRLPIEGGKPEFTGMEIEATRNQNLDLSPDGSRIAFSNVKGVQELWALDNVLAALK